MSEADPPDVCRHRDRTEREKDEDHPTDAGIQVPEGESQIDGHRTRHHAPGSENDHKGTAEAESASKEA